MASDEALATPRDQVSADQKIGSANNLKKFLLPTSGRFLTAFMMVKCCEFSRCTI